MVCVKNAVTTDGKLLFNGKALFELIDTYGFPLDMAIEIIINEKYMAIDWPEFVEAARGNCWFDESIYKIIKGALSGAIIGDKYKNEIHMRIINYISSTQCMT